jgi:hypothetical protein
MDRERLADEDETISPDVVSRRDQPVDPAQAVRREREKYGENSSNPNRDDQWDEHHGQPEDIV